MARKSGKAAHRIQRIIGGKERLDPKKQKTALAILGLVLNVSVLPGIGSIVHGAFWQGVLQLLMIGAGIALMNVQNFEIASVILLVVSWTWALLLSIRSLTKAL